MYKYLHLYKLRISIKSKLVEVKNAYDEIYIRREFRTANFFIRRNIRTVKFPTAIFPYGEISLRQNFLTAKFPYGEISYCLISRGEISNGEISGHDLENRGMSTN